MSWFLYIRKDGNCLLLKQMNKGKILFTYSLSVKHLLIPGGHLSNFCTRVCQRGLRNSTLSVAIFWKKTPFLLQFSGKKHAVCLANFAEMYPFLNKIAEHWHVAPKIVRIVLYIGSSPPGLLMKLLVSGIHQVNECFSLVAVSQSASSLLPAYC